MGKPLVFRSNRESYSHPFIEPSPPRVFGSLMFEKLACWLMLVIFAGVVGCDGQGAVVEDRQSAQRAFDEAVALYDEGQLGQAEPLFRQALEGELQQDLMVVAGVNHSKCLTELEKYPEALEAIERVREGLSGEDQYHLLRCEVYLAQGDQAGAKAEFEEAKKLNRQVKMPKKK